MADWNIERLGNHHDKAEFSCGKPVLDRFIREQASQYEKKEVGRTFVAVRENETRVLGYYTLAAGSLGFEHFPEAQRKKLPKHPVPVVLLGRLAVDSSMKGKGLGSDLLIDALKRTAQSAEIIGAFAMFVESLDIDAKGFYERFGFIPLVDQELHLYLPLKTIRQTLDKSQIKWR